MNKTLAEALGRQEADTVQSNPTLAFNYRVGLTNASSPDAHAEMDAICIRFGGMVVGRHAGTVVPCFDVELFTTQQGAAALAQSNHVVGLMLAARVTADGMQAYSLDASRRAIDSFHTVPTKVPVPPARQYD